jgi:hypothetical protein
MQTVTVGVAQTDRGAGYLTKMFQMDATDRIVEEFNRQVALGRKAVASRPAAERIVYYVVATRSEIDINGFSSVYEQDLDAAELMILVDGLRRIGEEELASEFRRGFELLQADGFYGHMNWNKVSDTVETEIQAIGKRVGDRLWALDEKLAALLDNGAGPGTSFQAAPNA